MAKPQSFAHHARLDRKWHIVLFGSWIIFSLVMYRGWFVYLLPVLRIGGTSVRGWTISIGLFFTPVVLFIALLTIRGYALKLQDRLIRLEERMRYHQLTGTSLHPELQLSQIIALRFASDEEFPALAQRALAEKMSAKQIKQSIKHRRADHQRV